MIEIKSAYHCLIVFKETVKFIQVRRFELVGDKLSFCHASGFICCLPNRIIARFVVLIFISAFTSFLWVVITVMRECVLPGQTLFLV